MKIRAKATASETPVVVTTPRTRTRPVIQLASPANPPPTTGSWVVNVHVEDAQPMFLRAVDVMKGKGHSIAEINARLCNGAGEDMVVDIAECLNVLFEFMYRSVEGLTNCKVDEPQLYLEPMLSLPGDDARPDRNAPDC